MGEQRQTLETDMNEPLGTSKSSSGTTVGNQSLTDLEGLTSFEREVLEFHTKRYKYRGQREQGIRELMEKHGTNDGHVIRYFQTLNALSTDPRALAEYPDVTARVRWERER